MIKIKTHDWFNFVLLYVAMLIIDHGRLMLPSKTMLTDYYTKLTTYYNAYHNYKTAIIVHQTIKRYKSQIGM